MKWGSTQCKSLDVAIGKPQDASYGNKWIAKWSLDINCIAPETF